jgi:hypothetical protein
VTFDGDSQAPRAANPQVRAQNCDDFMVFRDGAGALTLGAQGSRRILPISSRDSSS